jgi:hypothetical protein
MHRVVLYSLAALLLLALLSSNGVAQAPPSADTFVSSATPKTNYGSSPILIVQTGTTAYVQFNLSALPAGASVNKATLRLYVDGVVTSGSFDVFPVNSAWSENTLTYNTPPPALGSSATGNKPIAITSANFNKFVLIDITPLVQGWVSGTIPNNGVAVALTTSNGLFSFDAKESLLTGNGPELETALNGPAGPAGPQGIQGAKGDKGDVGPIGATGAQGQTGPQGATGTQGLQGPIGQTGATGPQGPIGPFGPAGPAGTNGTNGTGFNFRGAFDSGATYAAYDVVTYNGSTFNATTAIASGATTPDTNPQWQLMAQAGAAGATGPTGAKGDTGTAGTQGPQGQTGATGATGAQGPIGVDGSQGPIGPQGPQGPQGPTGDANARMIFPSFFPGNLSGTWLGGKLILDQPITVLRIAATAKTPTASGCPAAVFRFTDGTKGQELVLTPGQSWADTGSMVMTFAAGAALQASLRTGSTCASTTGADANLLVEYKIQAAGDTDSCAGTSCNGFCTSLTSDPSNCGTCGTACPSGTPCTSGACGSGGGGGCNVASDCPAGQACNTTTHVCSFSCGSSGQTACNGGCCDAGICAAGNSLSACGAGGGACISCPGCAAGQVACSGTDICANGGCQNTLVCANLQTDPNNCGGCNIKCGSGTICQNSVCSPAAPVLMGTIPTSPSSSTTPTVFGSAMNSSTVKLYTSPICAGPYFVSGPVSGGSFAVSVNVQPGSTTSFWATASTVSGTSSCSGPITYVNVP